MAELGRVTLGILCFSRDVYFHPLFPSVSSPLSSVSPRMKTSCFLTLLVASTVSVIAYGEPDLARERNGDVFRQIRGGRNCNNGILHGDNSTGTTEIVNGGKVEPSVENITKNA